MFVQVIGGHAKDRAGLRRQWQRWEREHKSTAYGYIGSTTPTIDVRLGEVGLTDKSETAGVGGAT